MEYHYSENGFIGRFDREGKTVFVFCVRSVRTGSVNLWMTVDDY